MAKKHENEVLAFCEKHGLTEDQFYGREKIPSYKITVDLLNNAPDGLQVGGGLDLRGTGITEEQRRKVKKTPDNFQQNLCAKVRSFRNPMIWRNGKAIKADGIFSELVSHKGNIYRTRQIGKERVEYLVTDGKGKWAHGATLQAARADLIYKIGNRDSSEYKNLTLDSVLTLEKAIEAYRVITGACAAGTRGFVESLSEVKKKYSIREIIEATKGRYGHEAFARFFKAEG
ncbi:MAG: hypothetical protein LBV80_08110 [Deltaproteobacteria bacterium]|nr:hypothetical protein [Deltaproteobacteria bacterium]